MADFEFLSGDAYTIETGSTTFDFTAPVLLPSEICGREPFVVIEIEQQKCQNTYGQAPCTASGSIKCYNTRKTCQDAANYDGTGKVTWRFIKDNSQDGSYILDASDTTDIKTNGLPFLVNTSTKPTKVNIGGIQDGSGGLGTRATLNVTFKDAPYTDEFADDYIISRTYNPLNQGTFWGKWLARNPYYQNAIVRIYEGYYGQQLSEMNSREYVLESLTRNRDTVSLKAKDPISLFNLEKAKIPNESDLSLIADIDASTTTIRFFGTQTDLDPIFGNSTLYYLSIGDELISYTGYSLLGNNQYELTGVVRGAFGTTAEAHETDDKAQRVVRYEGAKINSMLVDAFSMSNAFNVFESSRIFGWVADAVAEFDQYQRGFEFTGSITKPMTVGKFLSQVMIQANAYFYWHEREKKMIYRVNRAPVGAPKALTDDNHIIADSLAISEKPNDRKSRAIYYYNFDEQQKFLESREDLQHYKNVNIVIDTDAESDVEYGDIRPFSIFASFVTQKLWADTNSFLTLYRYRDTPRFATIKVDAKDGQLWIGDQVTIETAADQNFDGSPNVQQWQIISAKEVVSSDTMEYMLQSSPFFGRYGLWMDDNAPLTYAAATEEQRENGMFWSDNNGKMSDGSDGYKWQI